MKLRQCSPRHQAGILYLQNYKEDEGTPGLWNKGFPAAGAFYLTSYPICSRLETNDFSVAGLSQN
jgi:hypothetical protein